MKKKPKKDMEVSQFKRFTEMLNKIQANIPFGEALEQMSIYAKFMKDLLSGKHKLKNDENIALEEDFNSLIQRKIPPKLTDPYRFMIPCSIGSLTISHVVWDLGASINLIPLSMMRRLNYGEPNPTR